MVNTAWRYCRNVSRCLPALIALACPGNAEESVRSEPANHGDLLPAENQVDLRYGRDPTWQQLNLSLPERRVPVPLVIWIHGGAWVTGDKDNPHPATELVKRGYAVASVEYRPATVAAWPSQREDCEQAIRWLRSRAKQFRIDPDRFGVWGESAGGHLAAMLGVHSAGAMHRSRVNAVCDWFGPADLVNAVEDAPPDATINTGETLWRLCLGPAADNRRLRQSLSTQQRHRLLAAASPIEFISGDEPPFLIMHGDADRTVPLIQSQRFHERLQAKNVDATLQVIRGAEHRLRDRQDCIQTVFAFFDRTIAAGTMDSRPLQIQLEAEAAQLSGTARILEHPASSGGRNVGYIDTPDSAVVFEPEIPAAGQWTLRIRFATGPRSENKATHVVSVNNGEPSVVRYHTTGWDQWDEIQLTVSLVMGRNLIRIGKGERFAALDRIDLISELPTAE